MEGCIVPHSIAKSPVWVHFEFPGNADGTVVTKKREICCICSQEMPYTSNLFSHLECQHQDEYAKLHKTESSQSTSIEARQPSIFTSHANAVPLGASLRWKARKQQLKYLSQLAK